MFKINYRKGIASKDLIITLIVLALIGSLTTFFLMGAKKEYDTNILKKDLSFTFKTMYDKVKANQSTDRFNLEKVFNDTKGVYNQNQKRYNKTIAEKNINNKVSGIITYNNEDVLDIGSNSMDNTDNSLNSTKINKNLSIREVGFFLGIKENLNISCDGYGVDSDDKVLTVYDTVQNSDGVNDPTPDICRGGIEKEFINYFIFTFKTPEIASKVNRVYFGDEGKLMKITDGTNELYGVALIIK